MKNKDAFSGYHPIINFLYYALVLLFSMCLMHPVYLAISLTGALAYDITLKGRKAVRFADGELRIGQQLARALALAAVGADAASLHGEKTMVGAQNRQDAVRLLIFGWPEDKPPRRQVVHAPLSLRFAARGPHP